MKKILYFAAVLMVIIVSACSQDGKQPAEKTNKAEKGAALTADFLMTLEDVKSLVSYEPVMNVENTRQKSTVRFDSNPIGQDPVILELYSYNGKKSIAAVYEDFKQKKEKRPKAEDIEDLGLEAYIAYPSVNLYRDGYMIVVTAGSGADNAQAELLKKAGAIAAGHLDEYLNKNPTDSDLLAENKK